MWTPLKPSDGSEDTYGLGPGWGKHNERQVAGVAYTRGQQGTSTAFVVAPDQRAGVVVLTNMEDQPAADLAREILNILSAASEKKP
jgi:CubicO group peptidase (beta-lactamase class C family)